MRPPRPRTLSVGLGHSLILSHHPWRLSLLQVLLVGAILLGTFLFGTGFFPRKVPLEGFASATDAPAPFSPMVKV